MVMQRLGTSKVQKKCSKKNFVYPFVRFPRACSGIIGETVTIMETEVLGRRAFLVIVDGDEVGQPVEQPEPAFVQHDRASLMQRCEGILDEIHSVLTNRPLTVMKKSSYRWACPDSNRRSSPCKGDVMTS